MDWLQNNWIWLAAVVGFIAMHFYGHGGHGHGSNNRKPDSEATNGTKNAHDPAGKGSQVHPGHGLTPAAAQSKQHRHGS
jgi:hypothetical protein